MTDRDIKPENCPLCRRPQWHRDHPAKTREGMCAAVGIEAVCQGNDDEWLRELLDCRRVALEVAEMVAPVVEAAEELQLSMRDAPQRHLSYQIDAMRDGLRKLGGGS